MSLLMRPMVPEMDPSPIDPDDGEATSLYCEVNLCANVVCITTVCPPVTTVTHKFEVLALVVVYVFVVPSVMVIKLSAGKVVTALIGGLVKAVDGSGLPFESSSAAVVVAESVSDSDAFEELLATPADKTVVPVTVAPASFVVVYTLVVSPVAAVVVAVGLITVVEVIVAPAALVVVSTLVTSPVPVVAAVVAAVGFITVVDVILSPAAFVVVITLVTSPVAVVAAVVAAVGLITVVEVTGSPAAFVVVITLVTRAVPVVVPVVATVVSVSSVAAGVVTCVKVTKAPAIFVVVITVVTGTAAAAALTFVAGSNTEVCVTAKPAASFVTTKEVVKTASVSLKNKSQTIDN